eukprot:SAG31_NODE_24194_length_487_cov_0.628866_1_plen_64_part_00
MPEVVVAAVIGYDETPAAAHLMLFAAKMPMAQNCDADTLHFGHVSATTPRHATPRTPKEFANF